MEPIENIQWMHHESLGANDYNPNVVFTPELKLLERSILQTGWVQPVLASPEGVIIDGFHRWALSRDSKALGERYSGMLPVAILDVSREQAMILTVRMNRAKGSHVAVRMSSLVRALIDEHCLDPDYVAKEIGATRKEVDLLHQEDVFTAKGLKDAPYSKAWVPMENGQRKTRK